MQRSQYEQAGDIEKHVYELFDEFAVEELDVPSILNKLNKIWVEAKQLKSRIGKRRNDGFKLPSQKKKKLDKVETIVIEDESDSDYEGVPMPIREEIGDFDEWIKERNKHLLPLSFK